MRIAYLSQSYPPMVSGASLAVQMLAEGMAENGHQILVLTSSNLDKPYTQQNKSLRIYHHRSYVNPFRVGQRYTRDAYRKNLKLLSEFEPDIIHSHDPFQFGFAGLKYCQRNSIPITITTHQLPWFVKAYLPARPAIGNVIENGLWGYSKWLLRKYDHVISPTRTIANVIHARTGMAPDVINYGIELDVFYSGSRNEVVEKNLRMKFNIPATAPILLHVGRLDVDKSVDIVIRAAARSMVRNGAHLLVVGDGTEKAKLVRLCKDLGISARSHFPGFITSRPALADVYRMAKVFVTASEIETQGIVLLEAAACGLPIVAVNATCIPEIVKDGLNGYLVTPGDITGMTNRLSELLSCQEKARFMGQKGCSISKNFSKQKTIEEHAGIYAKAIQNSKHSPVPSLRAWLNLRTPFG
jgi:glycosyltransferase involved in cell wall biosynthesis